jgi:hypothetical protein
MHRKASIRAGLDNRIRKRSFERCDRGRIDWGASWKVLLKFK